MDRVWKVQNRKTKRLALQDTYATTQRAPILPVREKALVGRCTYSPLSPPASERARARSHDSTTPGLPNAARRPESLASHPAFSALAEMLPTLFTFIPS